MPKTAKKKASAKAEKTTAPEAPVVENADAPVQEDSQQLTIADLQAQANVIDAAVRRGAFGASEVSEVGKVYTKLTSFLKLVAEQQRQAEEGSQ